ncbi:CG34315, partial [Drosophila busckii]
MDTSKRPWSGRRERKKFCLITYLLFAAFLILACAQWYLFYLVDATKLFFKDYYWVGIIFFLIAWVLVIIFIYVEELRFIVPINWIMGILIYEFIVLSLSSLAVKQYQYHLGVSFVIWAIVLALFILLGTLIPHDLTLDVVVLVIFGILALLAAIYFLMLHIVLNVKYSFFVFRAFIVISILMFVMYHAQIINGGRFAEIRSKDYILAALILFNDFLLMYLFTFQLAPKWSDDCNEHWNGTHPLVVDKYVSDTSTTTEDIEDSTTTTPDILANTT